MGPQAAAVAVFSSAGLWIGGSLLVGALANRLPLVWLMAIPSPPLHGGGRWRLQAYERHGCIRRWKPWIPDAGAALPGGIRKGSLARRDAQALQRLLAETRRAEWVHWALWPLWSLTLLWLPPVGVVLNLLFATLFNLPCVLLQRYNRLRLQRALGRLKAPPNPPAAPARTPARDPHCAGPPPADAGPPPARSHRVARQRKPGAAGEPPG
jgi:glycosyl-4,4'-diaponeurosporenoate acyltransferase